MIPYWLLFALWGIGTIQYDRRARQQDAILFFLAAAATAMMIGLRVNVGGDWGAYERIYDAIAMLDLTDGIGQTDPAYALLNWLAARAGVGVWAVNMACGAVVMWGLTRFARRQINPWLTILIGVPYFIIVVSMGYTRQAAAIGIIMAGLAAAEESPAWKTIAYVLAAALFHKSAALVLPLIIFPIVRRSALTLVLLGVAFVALYPLALNGSSDKLITNYVQGTYDSQGAFIRIAMNVLAAILFFAFRRRWHFNEFDGRFWFVCSLISFASLLSFTQLTASVGIDRFDLFLIPLQLAILSRLPYVLGQKGNANPVVMIAVIGYSFAVQFVWLNYAQNNNYWLPYRTVLLGGGPS